LEQELLRKSEIVQKICDNFSSRFPSTGSEKDSIRDKSLIKSAEMNVSIERVQALSDARRIQLRVSQTLVRITC